MFRDTVTCHEIRGSVDFRVASEIRRVLVLCSGTLSYVTKSGGRSISG